MPTMDTVGRMMYPVLMVLFLLLALPVAYILALQFFDTVHNTARLIRNPLVIGMATFLMYTVVDNITTPLFSDSYLWADSITRYSIQDQVLPLAFATVFFVLFFRKIFDGSKSDQQIVLFSFLAGFLSLLNVRDLIVQINVLDSVDLFYRPFGRMVMLFLVPWSFVWIKTASPRRNYVVLNLFLVHLLVSLSSAAQYMNTPVWAALFFLIPFCQMVAILFWTPKITRAFSKVNEA